jgi:hypothetical protein
MWCVDTRQVSHASLVQPSSLVVLLVTPGRSVMLRRALASGTQVRPKSVLARVKNVLQIDNHAYIFLIPLP